MSHPRFTTARRPRSPRRPRVGAVFLLITTLLGACSGGGDGGSTGPTPPSTPTPTPAAVATVTVTPTTASLVPQQTTTLSAVTRAADNTPLTGRTVTWSSGAPAVATVSTAGVVTAVAEGAAIITATSEGRSGTATITVTPVPVSRVTLSLTTDSLRVGETRALEATARAADGSALTGRAVTWSSAQPAIASVANGVVTALSPGIATVTATSEGQSASAEITVRPVAVARVLLSDSVLTLVQGTLDTLTASPQSAAGAALDRPVTWSSTNGAVATVANGVVVAVAPGSTTIAATSEGVSATATVTIVRVPVATVSLSLSGDTITVGQTTTLTATARDGDGAVLVDRVITWTSSATAIATVTDGVVTALSPGTATISATSEGRSAVAQVVVRAPFAVADVRRRAVAGFEQSCGIGTNGSTYCWGWERYGALGNGRELDNFRTTADAVAGGPAFTSLAGGYSHSCGLTADGAAWCWGKATLGQIGNGTQVNASTPVAVSGGHVFTQLSAGSSDRTCGVTASGEIWCWGSNTAGALGAGASGTGSTVPVRVVGTRVYRQVMVGAGGACALRDDGAPFCWGANGYGQLGNGTTGGSSNAPVAVSGNHRFVELTAGFGHYCGRTLDNALWCWGFNSLGQLGDGTRVNRAVPVRADVGMDYVSIAAGSVTTCGITSSGSAFCWGGGSYGILGNGDTSVLNNFSLAPVSVLAGLPFRTIEGGGGVMCGVTSANTVYCWGNGTYGNLGNGTRDQVGVPTAVIGLP